MNRQIQNAQQNYDLNKRRRAAVRRTARNYSSMLEAEEEKS